MRHAGPWTGWSILSLNCQSLVSSERSVVRIAAKHSRTLFLCVLYGLLAHRASAFSGETISSTEV